MAPALQQILLRLWLDARDTSVLRPVGHNLHCIETGACVLQSVPTLHHQGRGQGVDPKTAAGVDLGKALKDWIFGDSIQSVRCLHGPPGSGKTHQLRKHMHRLDEEGVVRCTVSITEAFSLNDVVKTLHDATLSASRAGKTMAFCFQINLGKFKANACGTLRSNMGVSHRWRWCL